MNMGNVDIAISKRLEPFGETVFATWSRLAVEHDAINLGQGFPDFEAPEFIKEAAIKAIRDGENQYSRSAGHPVSAGTQARARSLSP